VEVNNIKTIYDFTKKIVTINEIQEYFKIVEYEMLYRYINQLIEEGAIEAVKSSKTNGMKKPLYNKYRILPVKSDECQFTDEINYGFYYSFNKDYYLKNIDKYKEDREYIGLLTQFYRERKIELDIPMSINERSYDIFREEKFLKDGSGKRVLNNLGISIEQLNIYRTPEPFVYFSINKEINQIVLIIENKDTWYTLRKLMLEGKNHFFNRRIDTIVYGSGKSVESSLEDYDYTVEEYLKNPTEVLYWGDIDYEGIGIYERLIERYKDRFNIKLFKDAYIKMADISRERKLASSKDKQNRNIKGIFFEELFDVSEYIKEILDKGLYIPQEIINYHVLKERSI
jgi:hypothetical protein